jgi:outer membrane protein TolC
VSDKTIRWNEINRAVGDHVHHTLHEMPPARAPVGHVTFVIPELAPPLDPSNYRPVETLPMHLAEAISVSIGNSDIVRTIAGPGQAALIATSYDPTIQEVRVRQALSAFDTQLSISQNWSKEDLPTVPLFDRASTRAGIERGFVTGTRLSAGLTSDYGFAPELGTPASYDSRLEFGLTQPLLRGAGANVNRVPLVIARAESDSSIWEFKAALQSQVRSIETAYRDLYASQESVRVLDEVVRLAEEVVRVQAARVELKAAVEADLAQAQSQLETIRQGLIEAETAMLTNETLLRNLLGWPANDGKRVIAVDPPSSAPFTIDWDSALVVAMENRPDIERERLAVLVREQLLIQARNNLMPQMDAMAVWRMRGEDPALDAGLNELLDGTYSDWLFGFSMALPVRNYDAGGQAAAAELGLTRERAILRQTVHGATHELTSVVRDLQAIYQQYRAASARLAAADTFLRGSKDRFENPRADSQLLLLLSVYLGALSDFSNATISVNQLLSQYNVALVRLEETQGILLANNGIYVNENPIESLPAGLYDQYLREHPVHRRYELPFGTPVGGTEVLQSSPHFDFTQL